MVMLPLSVGCRCAPWWCWGMPLHGGGVVDVPAAGVLCSAGWWRKFGPELVDLLVDGGKDWMKIEICCRYCCEPRRGDFAADLFPGDVDVGECWLAADELFGRVLVPGAWCLVQLPCAGFIGAGFNGNSSSEAPGAAGKAPFMSFVVGCIFVCCVCWLPFLPRHLDWREWVVPVDWFHSSTNIPCWPDRPRMASGASEFPNVPSTRIRPMMFWAGPACVASSPKCPVWLLPPCWGVFGPSLPLLCGGVPVRWCGFFLLMYCSSKMTWSVAVCFVLVVMAVVCSRAGPARVVPGRPVCGSGLVGGLVWSHTGEAPNDPDCFWGGVVEHCCCCLSPSSAR